MKTFIYPGSFDPLTKGHKDIAIRAASLCDKLIVAILYNNNKNAYFTLEERVELARRCFVDYPNIEVQGFCGLLVDLMKEQKALTIVRGIRSESDFSYELELTLTNKLLYKDYESILLPARQDFAFISSSIVKEVASLGGSITGMVPECIEEIVLQRIRTKE